MRLAWSWRSLIFLELLSLPGLSYGTPSVSVDLQASFDSPPFLLELLETAANENATAYNPLLDLIANGHFARAKTDQELYNTFVKAVQDHGFIQDASALSALQFALSLRSAAPRVEAHYQFYRTTVEKKLGAGKDCDNWLLRDGKQHCSLKDDTESVTLAGALAGADILAQQLPFDRIGGCTDCAEKLIIYGDPSSNSFGPFLKDVCKDGACERAGLLVRYKPSQGSGRKPLPLAGYGMEMVLKRTDYIVIDDRADNATSSDSETKPAEKGTLAEAMTLSKRELRTLGLKASSLILESSDPLQALQDMVQDFPQHITSINEATVSDDLLNALITNHHKGMPDASQNAIWINGLQVMPRDLDPFSLIEHLRKERQIMAQAGALGFNAAEITKLLAHASRQMQDEEAPRYDWRDTKFGGQVIIWMNDIESDATYDEWPTELEALLQPTFPGQLPTVRRDIHNVVAAVDLTRPTDLSLITQSLQMFIRRGVPVRFGIVPRMDTEASAEFAKGLFYVQENYGLETSLSLLERVLLSETSAISTPTRKILQSFMKELEIQAQGTTSWDDYLNTPELAARTEATKEYLARLSLDKETYSLLVNGVVIRGDDRWIQYMSNQVGVDSRVIQQAVMQGKLRAADYFPEVFYKDAGWRRNLHIIPDDEAQIRVVDLTKATSMTEGSIGDIPPIKTDKSGDAPQPLMVVLADFSKEPGEQLLREVVKLLEYSDQFELFLVHSGDPAAVAGLARSLECARSKEAITLSALREIIGPEHEAPAERCKPHIWDSSATLMQELGIEQGSTAIFVNGRLITSLEPMDLNADDLEMLLNYEKKRRIGPLSTSLQELGLQDRASSTLSFARLCSFAANVMLPPGDDMGLQGPALRTDAFSTWQSEDCTIEKGDVSTASVNIVAILDPLSDTAQRWVPLLKVLSELEGTHMQIFLNPRDRQEEVPVKRFYRFVLESQPSFDTAGALKSPRAAFAELPADTLLTMAPDVPPAWVVAATDSGLDLDNLRLGATDRKAIEVVYELENILIEGHSRDTTLTSPPRGAQLVLKTGTGARYADTIVMANIGYFQFKANPGFYSLALREGRSMDIFQLDSAGTNGMNVAQDNNATQMAMTSFRGITLYPRLSRKAGQEDEDVLEPAKSSSGFTETIQDALSNLGTPGNIALDWVEKAQSLKSSLLPSTSKNLQVRTHADINIFSVASGHLYERMLNIMMVSVMKHTSHSVKFWFLEQFLSPSFKALLPKVAEEYGFQYQLVTYKWPHWLRAQSEKQREIWGYKILFLDVLFPLDLDKIIFVDADQIVRTDMYELVQHDLKGAPYGFTPMCDSRTEMEGFRFWKQGYWANFLRGLPYHISALYVVDLVKFRQIAAGDRLRQQYHQLSADPGSLSNLDQDLPNHMQHVLPIHSLPQEWLWCETWCDDASLSTAKTIDLCNNPLTKEPKLDRARRQVPEWTAYDQEIASLSKRLSPELTKMASAGDQEVFGSLEPDKSKTTSVRERDEL